MQPSSSSIALGARAQAIAKDLVLRDGRVCFDDDVFAAHSAAVVGAGDAVAVDLVALAARLRREAPAASVLAIVQLCELAVLASAAARDAIDALDLAGLAAVTGAAAPARVAAGERDPTKSALATRLAALTKR